MLTDNGNQPARSPQSLGTDAQREAKRPPVLCVDHPNCSCCGPAASSTEKNEETTRRTSKRPLVACVDQPNCSCCCSAVPKDLSSGKDDGKNEQANGTGTKAKQGNAAETAEQTPPLSPPLDEQELAKRRRMEMLSQQLLRAGANLRVEQFSLGTVRTIVVVLLFVDLAAVALGVIISTFSFVSASIRVDGIYLEPGDPSSREFIIFAEAIMRTIACTILTFLLLVFPQRIIRAAIESNTWYRWEQGFIIVYILIMFATPVFNIYGIVKFWEGVVAFISLMNNFQLVATIDYFYATAGTSFGFSVFVTAFWTTFSHLYLHGMVHFQGHPREVREHEERKLGLLEATLERPAYYVSSTEFEPRSVFQRPLQRGDGEDAMDMTVQPGWFRKLQTTANTQRAEVTNQVAHAGKTVTFKYLGGLDICFVLMIGLYFSLTCGLGIYLGFHPSYVPVVSLVTLIRLCTTSAQNLTSISNQTLVASNGDIFLVTYNSTLDPSLPICSSSQPHNTPFWIAVTLGAIVLLDVYFFVSVSNKARETHRNLRSLPYATTRSNQLGYAFFRMLTWISFICIGVLALVLVILQPETAYLFDSATIVRLSKATMTNSQSPDTYSVLLGVRPFNQVGIGPGIFGFGCIYVMWVAWMAMLAFGYLPANSGRGCMGWLYSRKSDMDNVKYSTKRFFRNPLGLRSDVEDPDAQSSEPVAKPSKPSFDHVLLLSYETDIATLKDIQAVERTKEEQFAKRKLPFLQQVRHRRLQSQKSLMHLIQPKVKAARDVEAQHPVSRSPLQEQIAANVFVLETEILLFHFMSLAYDLCEKIPDTAASVKAGAATPATAKRFRTFEEMQGMVEDKRFTLDLYAEDAETDTHAFVFSSNDRIVVSFRGSVSLKNYQTDWDSAEVEYEHGKYISPLLEDEVNFTYSKNLASRPAFVHGGFVKAYDTVKHRIREKVNALLNEAGGSKRCVFVTGHSLGGGLAIICAFDLGFVLSIPPTRIALSTWGCPKVGTFSFVRRFARVVPCAHRVATANDLITKLPFESPLNEWTLHGWHHVGVEVLLISNGNMIISPSAIELFMIHNMTSSVSAHFRMSYAVALAAWVIRTDPDMHADWWMRVINQFHSHADFSQLPPKVRELLLWDLRRPGAAYFLGSVLVRDMAVDTASAGVAEEEESSEERLARERRVQFIEDLHASKESEDAFRRALLEFVKQHYPLEPLVENDQRLMEEHMSQRLLVAVVEKADAPPKEDENHDSGGEEGRRKPAGVEPPLKKPKELDSDTAGSQVDPTNTIEMV